MEKNLCCEVNPLETCTGCGRRLCEQHSKEVRRIDKLQWCKGCTDSNYEYIDYIGEYQERNEDLRHCVTEAVEVVWDLVSHATHCRDCRGEAPCADLFRRLASAEQEASYIDRKARKL